MARLVRCPKCSKLLVEYPQVPVYKCGGCQTVLRAKNHKTTSENVDASPERALSVSGSTTSANEMLSSSLHPASSTRRHSTEESPQFNQPDVMSENGFSDKELPPPCSSAPSAAEDHDEEEERPNDSSPDSIVNCKHLEIQQRFESERRVTEVETQRVENEQVVDTYETHNEAAQSAHLVAQVNEDIIDTEQHFGYNNGTKSAVDMSPQTYDGSVSSSDDGGRENRHPSSRRTTRRWSNKNVARDEEEAHKRTAYLDDKSGYFDVVKSFNAIKQEIISKYQSGEVAQGRAFHSAEFAESERIRPYESPVKGDLSDHMELLRKVDELKAQIVDLYTEKDNRRGRNSSMPSNARAYNRNRSHEYSHLPFPEHKHCSCLHCLENQHSHSDFRNSSGKNNKLEKCHSKEKPKLHCRPVSGAAPFVVCYHCFRLLQLPADFIVSRKRLHKLQCGACNEIMMLSFPGSARKQTETCSEVVDSPVNKRENGSRTSVPPQLHRLMGYDSATELLYTRNDFDEEHESMSSTPARNSYRASALRGRDNAYNEQVRYSNSSLPTQILDELESTSRLNGRTIAVPRLQLGKESPNSM